MLKNILITGCSSGLGLALCKLYLKKGFKVYGISRKTPNIENSNFIFKKFDLSNINTIKKDLSTFILNIENLNYVYLNAGTLGEIKHIKNLSSNDLSKIYDINVYANKEILDILVNIKVDKIIAISSGASVNAYEGWAGYCLSKSGLNMLIKLYAQEFLNTKLFAIAPGVIATPMTDYIKNNVNDKIFTSAKKIKYGERQSPFDAAERLDNCVNKIKDIESGSFIDVRDFK